MPSYSRRSYYEPAKSRQEEGIRPMEYSGPISYGAPSSPSSSKAPPQPSGYVAVSPAVAAAYGYPPQGASIGYGGYGPPVPGSPSRSPSTSAGIIPTPPADWNAAAAGIRPGPPPGGQWPQYGGMYHPGMQPMMHQPGAFAHPADPGEAGFAAAQATFAPYGALPAGVKLSKNPDNPPTMMITPALAGETASIHRMLRIEWDLRDKPGPETVACSDGQPVDLSQPATSPPTRDLYIVAKPLPWAINIKKYNVITVMDVLLAIWKHLQEPMTREEFFIADEKKRNSIHDYRERADRPEPPPGKKGEKIPPKPLRVDFLCAQTDFKGLYLDKDILTERCSWNVADMENAWAMDLGIGEA